MPFYRCPATVPEHGIWVHLVMTGEKRDYVMPNPSRKQNGVQQDSGRLVVSHKEV
jgi:hypothetical protein